MHMQCDETTALQVLLQQVLSETENTKVAVVGAGCSQATDITAQVSHQFNLLQVSSSSSYVLMVTSELIDL